MAEVHDWRRVADPHAVIHYAVQALRQGRTVAFPTETGYALTASGLIAETVSQLGSAPLTLAVRGAAEARDWAPAMSPLAQRLARRLWPGPVTLLVDGVEQGLASRLPADVRARLCPEGTLRLATADHESLLEVLRHLAGPLLLASLPGDDGTTAIDAAQVLHRGGARVDIVLDDGPRPSAQPATLLAVNGDGWQVVQPGVISEEQIRQQMACLLVFICTGNTCRSPLAEALCKKRLADQLGCTVEELPARGFYVLSAGLSATLGGPAAVEAEKVARTYGADLSAHHSQPLTPDLATRADYLVGMTTSHVDALTDHFAHLGVQPRLLDPAGDIADPIGCAGPVYEACGRHIWSLLESLVTEILPSGRGQP